jgi:hypothetical protein
MRHYFIERAVLQERVDGLPVSFPIRQAAILYIGIGKKPFSGGLFICLGAMRVIV